MCLQISNVWFDYNTWKVSPYKTAFEREISPFVNVVLIIKALAIKILKVLVNYLAWVGIYVDHLTNRCAAYIISKIKYVRHWLPILFVYSIYSLEVPISIAVDCRQSCLGIDLASGAWFIKANLFILWVFCRFFMVL